MHKKIGMIVLAFFMVVGVATPSFASTKDSFCRFDAYFTGQRDMARRSLEVTLALQQINSILSVIALYKLQDSIIKAEYGTSNLKRTMQLLKFWKPAKVYISAMVPPLDMINKTLKVARPGVEPFKASNLNKLRTVVKGLYITALTTSTAVAAFKIAALSVCGKTKAVGTICVRQKKKCGIDEDDLYDADNSCLSDDEKIQKFIALGARYTPGLQQMENALKKLESAVKVMSPGLNTLKKLLTAAKSPAQKAYKALGGFKKGMKPFFFIGNQVKKALDKKICAKIAKVKKCFRVSKAIKQLKKLDKFSKPIEKQIKKVLNPILKPLLKKLPSLKVGGLDKFKRQMTGFAGTLSKAASALTPFRGNPFKGFTQTLGQLDNDLKALQ